MKWGQCTQCMAVQSFSLNFSLELSYRNFLGYGCTGVHWVHWKGFGHGDQDETGER